MAIFKAFKDSDIINALEERAPHADVASDSKTLDQYQNDSYGLQIDHDHFVAIVKVSDVKDIQGVLSVARQYHLPVVPQTAATSVVSGSDAINHGILLSTAKMNQILEINPSDQVAVVQPGVINKHLNDEANKVGMLYGPDPASRPMSSIGGNVNTNAGGMSNLKYGSTKDSVLGLQVVLADGRILNLGGKTYKQAFGYDLTHLFVGSEGTLGIITKVTVKLFPIPKSDSILGMAFFNNLNDLSQAVATIRTSGVSPSMLEAMDHNVMKAIDQKDKTDYADKGNSMLVFKLDNHDDDTLQTVRQILRKYHATDLKVTKDAKEKATIIKARQDMLPAVYADQSKAYVMEDMAVPMSKFADLMASINDISKKLDVNIYVAGHAGDGNVHPIVNWPKSEKGIPDNVQKAVQMMFRKSLELGGTISGEHSVGSLKNQWVNTELGNNVDYLQQQIKSLLDPMHILNPKRKID
ncbi:FAD-binding protein [Philodulcilactobacillus myokoensis]|uniref:FAD-binding protein n=1 Tax=Philodulcilactobacillus myokoensis TaxID=2929573 RepID=A0A9W6B298_9LACO|nr:FAD-linked oxidase C-terminal domain-containing protein [Philodulcilactobacillus myokoensis]GLB47547.1 FAD-binding protein [Philodulcilactobacillus myokoensis]